MASQHGLFITGLIAIFLLANVFSYTSLMDGKKYSLLADGLKLGILSFIIFHQNIGISELNLSLKFFLGYSIISTLGTFYFLKTETRALKA
jgi:hypothetical protein